MFTGLEVFILTILAGVGLAFAFVFFYFFMRAREKQLKAEDMLLENKKELFSKKFSLMREDEKALFRKLESIIGENYYVFPQVHLTELIHVKEGKEDHDNLYQILGLKSVDFAIFGKQNIEPVVAIELNGESHFAASRKSKDEEKKMLFNAVGIGFLTIPKDASYNIEYLKKQILPYLT